VIAVRPLASPADWEAAQAIRFEVFVDEQQVPAELELDEYDATARHWLAVEGEAAVGTARAVTKDFGWKIGRVAVRAPWRGKGVGARLMRVIEEAARLAGVAELRLESQTHAIPFYERLGYAAEGPEYLDCGIPHRLMRLRLLAG
jgi:predicted GNAT family N-acyltransferase